MRRLWLAVSFRRGGASELLAVLAQLLGGSEANAKSAALVD